MDLIALGANELRKLQGKPPKIRTRQFRPRLEGGRWELSTFCMDGLPEQERWLLLEAHVRPQVVARAEVGPVHVESAQLLLDPDWNPERHVNIVGWPDEEDAQLSRAQVLSDHQSCYVR